MYDLPDTDDDPKAKQAWMDALRALTPDDKLRLVFEMIDFMDNAAVKQIREEFPGIGEHDLLRELATRRYGRELAERAYPRTMKAGG